jgi:hypothetical protein
VFARRSSQRRTPSMPGSLLFSCVGPPCSPGTPLSPARPDCRPDALAPGQIGSGISLEVSLLCARALRRSPVRAVPSGGCRPPDHPASTFVRRSRGTHAPRRSHRPCGFSCLASVVCTLRAARAPFVARAHVRVFGEQTPPARVIRGWCSSKQHTYRARARAVLAAWSGRAFVHASRRRPWDSLNPSQFRSGSCG